MLAVVGIPFDARAIAAMIGYHQYCEYRRVGLTPEVGGRSSRPNHGLRSVVTPCTARCLLGTLEGARS
jgi:hypothetical protein